MIAGMIVFWIFALVIFGFGIRIVRPVDRGLIETFGKFTKIAEPGFNWIIPIVQRMIYVNITETMVDVPPQFIITKDNLNAEVDAQVYYKVTDVEASKYKVDDHRLQLAALARTTLRAVLGKMSLADANEKRSEINKSIEEVLDVETDIYGVEVLRVEIQRIEPPQDVQVAMNQVVKSKQEKLSAVDRATAAETEADGRKRAVIKEAEGVRQAKVLEAQGQAEAIKLVNEATEKYFVGNAQEFKRLETIRDSIDGGNTKIIITPDLMAITDKIMGRNGS